MKNPTLNGLLAFVVFITAYVVVQIWGDADANALNQLINAATPLITALIIGPKLSDIEKRASQAEKNTNGLMDARLHTVTETLKTHIDEKVSKPTPSVRARTTKNTTNTTRKR